MRSIPKFFHVSIHIERSLARVSVEIRRNRNIFSPEFFNNLRDRGDRLRGSRFAVGAGYGNKDCFSIKRFYDVHGADEPIFADTHFTDLKAFLLKRGAGGEYALVFNVGNNDFIPIFFIGPRDAYNRKIVRFRR